MEVNQETLWRAYAALPAEAKRQVLAFIEFLASRPVDRRPGKPNQLGPLIEEPFVGMWSDRKDLADSTAWVRSVRQREWDHPRG